MEFSNDLVPRLARAAAHGVRQRELVNELLAGPALITSILVPGQPHPFKRFGSAGPAVQVDFSRYGRKLMVRGRVQTPSGEDLEYIRLAPLMTYIRSSVRK